jgi:hypothetical protein
MKEVAYELIFGKGAFGDLSPRFQETLEKFRKEVTSEILSLHITWNAASPQQQIEVKYFFRPSFFFFFVSSFFLLSYLLSYLLSFLFPI